MKWTVLLLAPALVLAQESVQYASVSGRVSDSSGGVVAAAQVVARQIDTNLTASMLTGEDGRFRFAYLRPGAYEIVVRRPGFAETKQPLTLNPGSAFELPLVLAVASAQSTIEVSADAAVLETARSQIAATV